MHLIRILLLCIAPAAYAFPSNTRYGYTSCSSCHVSPTGGGVLTSYGRMSAAEFLSSAASPKEENILYGAAADSPLDEVIRVGGDSRYISVRDATGRSRNFWMQNDIEIAVSPAKNLTLVGSMGAYPATEHTYEVESRRNYVLFRYNENISLRAGRFFPAYGIMLEDHTAATRAGLGWNEGRETYNFELAFQNEVGELFISPMLGTENNVKMRSKGYTLQGDQKGFSSRAALYLGKNSLAGISALGLQRLTPGGGYTAAGGMFGILGITQSIYALLEADVREDDTETRALGYVQLGYEVVKGLHLQMQAQRYPKENELGVRVQWFARPHMEVVTAYAWRDVSRALFLLHYYL